LQSAMPEAAMDALVARVISAGGTEGVTFDGPNGGLTSEQFTEHASGAQAALQADADAYVAAQGINVAEFHKYVRSKPDLLRSTALTLWYSRDPSTALDAVLREFARSPAARRSR
jgi:hypothetical protein